MMLVFSSLWKAGRLDEVMNLMKLQPQQPLEGTDCCRFRLLFPHPTISAVLILLLDA